MKKQNLGQKTYLIVQNPFPSIENYKNSRTFEKFKNTKVKSIVFQEQFKNNSRTIQGRVATLSNTYEFSRKPYLVLEHIVFQDTPMPRTDISLIGGVCGCFRFYFGLDLLNYNFKFTKI